MSKTDKKEQKIRQNITKCHALSTADGCHLRTMKMLITIVNRAASTAAVDPGPRSREGPGMTFLRWDDSLTQIAKHPIFQGIVHSGLQPAS